MKTELPKGDMATTSEMLKALHKADPSTLNKRYTDAQLLAAYNKLSSATKTPAKTTTPSNTTNVPVTGGASVSIPTTESPAIQAAGTTQTTVPATEIDPQRVATRIEYLKEVRPNDPQIAELQAKLKTYNAAHGTTGGSGGTGGTGGTNGNGGTTPSGTDSNGNPVTETTPSSIAITPEMIDRFNQTVNLGKTFGNSLIGDLGLQGQFLGRVAEGPSDSYYSDLANLRTLAGNAGNPSALDSEALANARAALPGLDSVENSALRSAAVQDVDRQFGQARQQLLRYQGGLGSAMQRSAQIEDLGAKRVDAQRSLARDLLIQNIQEKKDARNAFAELTGQVGARADSRTQNLNALLQTGGLGADQMKQTGQQINTGLQASETSARTSALTGAIGAVGSAVGGYKAEDFQNTALQEALAAKDKEIEATKTLAQKALESQEKIANMLKGQI